jgi:hypothetical protein
MGVGLPTTFFKTITFLFALLLCAALQEGYGQSTGDIAVIGFNSDGNDDFAITTFVDIPSGTTIYFTDRSWDGATESFSGSEGVYSYTVPSGGFNAGNVITINPNTDTASDGGTVSQISGNFNLTNGGDELYLYLSSASQNPEDNPSTFLFAISNDNSWDSNELSNTGLTNETTALSDVGGSINDNGEYVGTREGTVSTLKQEIQKVGSNWATTDDTGDQSISFNTSSFSLVDPPTIAFNSSVVGSSENSGTAELTVELVESNSTAVDVEVSFLSGSSTATNGDDFASYSTETVSFSDSDGDSTTKTISVNLTDDSDFEGSEKAVFQLQNISTGTIISPEVLTLTIEDNDAPDIVINEILYDPTDAGDANGDGTEDETGDEFVEIVNNSNRDIDISNWTLSDGASIKYTFPSGTVIPADRAFVVFASPGEGTDFGGAYLFSAGSLGLNNTGDDVILKDDNGNEITSFTYSGSESNESITRNPDIEGSFEGHTTADSDDSSPFSPGTKVNGDPFGADHAIAFRGTEGWRMISSPVQSATFSDFFGDFWMQGIPGSDDPGGGETLFGWNESGGGSFNVPDGMSSTLTPGQGYIVYVFEDDEYSTPGIQGGFPKVVSTNGTENSGTVNVSVSANDTGSDGITDEEGWNMLGNPFGSDVSVTAILNALESVHDSVNTNVYIWDHQAGDGNGGWKTKSNGDLLAPFQAFFVRFTEPFSSTDVSFNKSSLEANQGTDFFKNVAEESFYFDLELHGEQYYDAYTVEFSEKGSTALDRYDAYKLFSLNPNSINLYSTLSNNRLQKNVMPRELDSKLEIPLSFDVNGRNNLTFRWNNLKELPNNWQVMLIDKEIGREIDLRRSETYNFSILSSQDRQNKTIGENNLLNKRKEGDEQSRFVLSVNPNVNAGQTDLPSSVKLNPNYPNPFNPTTTIPYEIAEDAEVKLTVWNMIGQKVATLVDGMVEAGTHEEPWNASNMPSGIYIARFEVGNEVYTRKMTLIK